MANTWGGTYYNITNARANVLSVLSAGGNIWVAQRHNKKLSLYPELSLVEQGAFFVTALLSDPASGRCRLLPPLLYCALFVCSYLGLSCLHPAHGFSSAPRAPSLLFFTVAQHIWFIDIQLAPLPQDGSCPDKSSTPRLYRCPSRGRGSHWSIHVQCKSNTERTITKEAKVSFGLDDPCLKKSFYTTRFGLFLT